MSRITRRQFLLGGGAVIACGVGVAAGLSGNRWWEWSPPGTGEIPSIEAPGPWSVEARHYASFSSEGSLNCTSCHSTTEEALPVSYCHIPHTGTYVQCNLCPNRCIIADGERGTCRGRHEVGSRCPSPSDFLTRPVHDTLGCGIGVDSGHDRLLQANPPTHYLKHRCNTVRGTTRTSTRCRTVT